MLSKADAERMEFSLLKFVYYAWNKGANGARRPDNVLKKLGEVSLGTHQLSSFARGLLHFSSKKVGIKIKGEPYVHEMDLKVGKKIKGEPHPDKKDSASSYHDRNGFSFGGIIKLSRSCPPSLYGSSSESVECDTICGIALANGMICRNAPAKGRKRCPEHKGMKISMKQQPTVPSERICSSNELYSNVYQSKNSAASDNCPAGCSSFLICGVILVTALLVWNHQFQGGSGAASTKACEFGMPWMAYLINRDGNEEGTICGVNHGDGTVCTMKPDRGRKDARTTTV